MDNDPDNRFEEEEKPLVSNKLKIKLKGLNRGIVHGDDGKEDRDWICKICSKKFSSCKALGGHMRVHSENFADDGVAGDDFSRKRKFRVLESDGKATCSLCDKSFASLKSLFGHMRSHPERDYRGMIPPENSPSSGISSEQELLESAAHKVLPNDEEMIDCSWSCVNLLACLSDGWSANRRKRSGKNAENPEIDASKSMLELDEYEYGAVEGLMMLANCHKSDYKIDEDKEEEDESAVKKMKRSSEDATNSSIVKSYKCNICSKAFSTPQALGGHTSSAHTKILRSPDVLMVEAVTEEEDDDAIKKGSVAVSHVCKDCKKAFPSGQALGGHMRRHYQAPAGAAELPLALVTCDPKSTDEPAGAGELPLALVTCDRKSTDGPAGAGELQLALVTCDLKSTDVPHFDLNEIPADQN